MDQNNQANYNDDLTFADIIRMFKGKLKLIICITLIGALLGAGVGVFTSFSNEMYGGNITFYLVPGEDTQSLLQILKSDSFAEKLLLDENGLPPKAECNAADYDAALAAVQSERAARAEKAKIYKELTHYPYILAPIETEMKSLEDKYDDIFNLLQTYESAQDQVASQPEHLAMIAEYEKQLDAAAKARDSYKAEKYDPAVAKNQEINEAYFLSIRALDDARKSSDELVEKVVAPWRNNEENKALVNLIRQSVTYNYAKIVDSENSVDSKENQNIAFLEISVSVAGDEELASRIVDLIKSRTPDFVEKNIERLTGNIEPQCTLISTFVTSDDISESSLTKDIVIYAVVFAVVAAVMTCAVIIVKGLLPADLFEKKEKKDKIEKKTE